MSLHTVGSDATYILPASENSIPEAFRSNRSAKPIPCVLQTVNLPSLTATAGPSGSSVIQVPCGSSSGIALNPYLSFTVTFTGTDKDELKFRGAARCASSLFNRFSTYLNSVLVDNIQSADQVYDCLFAHSTSADWLTHDAQVLMRADSNMTVVGTAVAVDCVVPLIGLLGSQQAMPLYLINGTLQIQIDYSTVANAVWSSGTAVSNFAVSNMQLVYDRLQPEQAFMDSVRAQMMQGQNFVYAYTNYQSIPQAIAAGGVTSNFNYGMNVSSLRGVIQTFRSTTEATNANGKQPGNSINNSLTQFRVSLDGRLINSNTLDSVSKPAQCFAEGQKCLSRIFDASITDYSTLANYLSSTFFVGVSAQRVNEGLAFAGSPVSVVSIESTYATANSVAGTAYILLISDYQLLIDHAGSVQIVR